MILAGIFDIPTMDAEFRRVHDTFKANLTAGELDYFRGSGLEHVQIALQRIQKEQEGKRQLLYLNRIDPYLKTMIEYGKVVEVFLNVSEILAFIWVCLQKQFSSF